MSAIEPVITKPERTEKGTTPINMLFGPRPYLWKLPFDNNSRKRAGHRGLEKGLQDIGSDRRCIVGELKA